MPEIAVGWGVSAFDGTNSCPQSDHSEGDPVIHRVHIENMRVIKQVDTTLEQLTVLVGPNGAGKSTFMDALGGMLAWSSSQVRETGGNYYQQGERLPPVNFDGWLEFAPFHNSSGNGLHYRVSLSRIGEGNPQPTVKWLVNKSNEVNEFIVAGMANNVATGFTDVPQFVLPLRLNPEFLKRPAPKQTNLNVFASDGTGLAAYLANVKLEDDDQFEFLKEAVCEVVPSIKNIVIDSKTDAQNYKLEVLADNGERVPAQYVSDGTIYTIALITAISWTRGRPGLILIDDIDHGLHPKAQQELIKQLRKLLNKMPELQIVATAHSPYLLDQVLPEEIRCLSATPECGTNIAKLSDHSDFEQWKDEMRPGEFWSSIGESWVSKVTGA